MKDRLYRDILPKVTKPARYTGGELNMVVKEWEQCDVHMALAFPDVYEVGMSHVGSRILYGVVNETSRHLMERTYAPWPDMEAIMRAEKIPLFTLDSFRPLRDFDVVGFSLQYELSLTNVLNMLDLADIPLWAGERSQEHPLIIGGGPVATNPEPFADFFDVLVIGDGEEVILELLNLFQMHRGLPKTDLLTVLAGIEGVYVPSLYRVEYDTQNQFQSIAPLQAALPQQIKRRVVASLEKAFYPNRPLVPYMPIVHDRAVLEVMRGCQRGCRFCHAGMVYRPVRERSLKLLLHQADEQLKNTGYEEISLMSLSTLDYSGIQLLVQTLIDRYGSAGIGVALPSLRVDRFSIDLANQVQKVRKTTLTLAPEAGTQRMRDRINKNVSEDQMMEAVAAAFSSGWLAVKLYFMIGLPGETWEDLDGILDLLKKVKSLGDRLAPRRVEVRASLACYVPKPHTPFQWQKQDETAVLDEKRRYLNSRRPRGVKMSFHDSQTSFLEGVVARGDRRLAAVIYGAWQNGCRFDGWTEHFHYAGWEQAFANCGIDPSWYVLRQRSYEEALPWDIIDTGISTEFLISENEQSLLGIPTPDCRQDGCTDCGVCPALGLALDVQEVDQ